MNKKYFTRDEMYQIDDYTINTIGIPSAVLMERAALCVFEDMITKLSKETHILLVAGPGNNGGDAVALARMLYLESYKIKLYVTPSKNYSDGMKKQMKIAQNINLPLTNTLNKTDIKKATVIVDGIFGIGLSRDIEEPYRRIIQTINDNRKQNTYVIALDIPSGFSVHEGRLYQPVVIADCTYTFGYRKLGMDKPKFQAVFGEIKVCPLGYPDQILKERLFS